MYGFTNKVENRAGFDILCAYSAPSPDGGADIWKIGRLGAGKTVTGIDIDYIRPESRSNYFWYASLESAVNWTSNDWCKIRQMVTTSIFPYEGRPTIGSLKVGGRWSGDPAPALVEAKKVDDNWFSSDATKKSRGVEAVKAAIAEWESIVQSGNLAMIGA